MTNYEIFKLINTISGDKLKSKSLTPERAELLIKVNSLKHFKEKVGVPEQYKPGTPILEQAYEITRTISVDLSPFKVHMGKPGVVPLYVDPDGIANSPSNMYYPGTMSYKYVNGGVTKDRSIDIVSDATWNERKNDSLTQPTLRNPIANIQDGYIRFSPIVSHFVEFVYLKFPEDPVFAYTQTDGFVKYDAANSTELEWDELNQIQIVYLILSDLGINITKPEISQYAEKVKADGL